jgi:predicted transglutaminase-like cysteine proteinase
MTGSHSRGLMAAFAISLPAPAAADSVDMPTPHRAMLSASPDVFGTAAIGAGVTFYDARFRRVARTDQAHPLVLEIAGTLRGLAPEQQLAAAHRQVLQKVRWAHDLDTMRVADLWANAGETLERGAGDSEDIAIVTMQVLKAAGWNPRDLYISIGRERKVGSHIVLLARAPSGFYVLDDRANRAMTPREHARFTPILTLSEGKSWIHGRRRSASTARMSAR